MTSAAHPLTGHIRALTALRGIAAVCIVLFHYDVDGFAQPTRMGVAMFFMLSGFLLQRRHNHVKISQWQSFTLPRLARLYSIHWVALATIIAVRTATGTPFAGKWLTAHLLLIQAWIPQHDAIYAHNPVAWFLSALAVCYCAFVPLAGTIAKAGKRQCATLALALIATQTATVLTIGGDLAYTHPLSRIQDFILGMTLGRLTSFMPQTDKRSQNIAQAAATLLTIATLAADKAFPDALAAIDATLLWWPSTAALICAFSATSGTGSRIVAIPPLVWLGTVSLEIYLFQCPAALIWDRCCAPVAAHFGFGSAYQHYALPSLVLLLAAAWIIHNRITMPLWHAIGKHTKTPRP